MEFFGSVTRIFGACVPSVAPCAYAQLQFASRNNRTDSTGFRGDDDPRGGFPSGPVPSSSPVPAPWESRVSSVPFHHRTIPIAKPPPPPPPPPPYFRLEERRISWTKQSFYRRAVATDIYIYICIYKRKYRNEDL